MTYSVTGVYTSRNSLEANYPFVESILTVLPAVDEFLINDGGSDDGTLDVLEQLERQYDRIELYHLEDEPSEKWECVDRQLRTLIDDANGEWIFESQADELWDPEDIREISRILDDIHDSEYNSIRQPRREAKRYGGLHEYVYETVRIVRNIDGLDTADGGDNFYVNDSTPTTGYTSHSVQPEYMVDVPFYHANMWYDPTNHDKRHAEWLATEQDTRQELYDKKKGKDFGLPEYEIDERMFDKVWLSRVTGFDYTSL